jgi:hypothetical protein
MSIGEVPSVFVPNSSAIVGISISGAQGVRRIPVIAMVAED